MVCCLCRNPWKKRYRGKQEKASKKQNPKQGMFRVLIFISGLEFKLPILF